jgi:hypothetical protein
MFPVHAADRIEAWLDPVGIVTADFVEEPRGIPGS